PPPTRFRRTGRSSGPGSGSSGNPETLGSVEADGGSAFRAPLRAGGRRMGMWAAWTCRARAGEPALTRHEQRRFDEIARRLDPDPPPVPPATAVVPTRLAAVGLLVVAATGMLIGLASGDVVVLIAVGAVPVATAVLLLAL